MKLMTYEKAGTQGVAAMRGAEWVDLGPMDLLGAIDAPDLDQRVSAAPVLDMSGVKLLPPLPKPGKIICVGLNYADHAAESPYDAPDYPTLFPRFTTSLIADGDPIVRPRISHELDFEGELVAIIGTTGRNIPKAKATSHVAAYSIFNDGSVRDYQFKAPQWTVGKNFDDTGAFGPYAVTADELPDGAKGLRLQTRLNGEVVQSASTDDLLFPVADLISIISEAITLEAGDIIVTGTPAGIGWARTPKLFMKPGDVVEVEIEGIGTLRNPVVDEAA
ncbi:5-oxopent-3-ene-1,2,5-tricarboxylate decarboxylase [Haematobacter massiliensis]|uniref:5-oxopent-3-ene-1,2,5-tricarboxylate decarboxylase n=1 Tax=Haematobacter massiliensis TaxID=195105 RepID=A0A086Y6Q5_9RHOB|nr:fumarylacetoacetate hydrolase family protein [Haematobacter massiliensis]KFI29955.1 5-oxopent-3-ene-1,2,5-tricarboxylate decarboxylase [Haematobacter massiliensis]OWJ69449.1 5-oxopent-3-ene-1,2,5-tricarboxylate decarboxylase [Haematobacter massiliensis]OWJ86894.1 5-oxopent-3-ene-1,2,5-tricarboxylate decarboxylase [Haematobacter massiliensis]QBJ25462.1 FAA hydrolase family protein [Haematobacter massiliensis]